MQWRPLILILLLGLVTAVPAFEVHKRQTESGSVEYSDQPQPGSDAVQLPPVNTLDTPEDDRDYRPPERPLPPESREDQYEEVRITDPANDVVVRDNQGDLSLSLSFKPRFHQGYGHQIQVLVDGQLFASFSQPGAVRLQGLYRGSHTIMVRIVDKDGETLATSNSITVHMKQHSILHPKPVH